MGPLPGINNYTGTTGTPEDINFWTVRIDHQFSQNDQIYGRYMQSLDRFQRTDIVPLSGRVFDNNMHNAMISETHTFSPSTINEFRVGYNRGNFYGGHEGSGGINYANDVFGFKNVGGGPTGYGLPNFEWTGFSTVGPTADSAFGALNNTYQISDNLLMNFGNHALKAGFDVRNIRLDWLAQVGIRGLFRFNGFFSQAVPGDVQSGHQVADFMLGLPQETWGLAGSGGGLFDQTLYGLYVQDDWRVSPKLTVNLGLRYEYYSPWNATRGQYSVFEFVAPPGTCFEDLNPCPPTPLIVPEEGGSYYNADKNDFGPRIGLAYSPFGDNKTVIRAAYGIFYSPPDATDQTNGALNPPNNVLRFINPTGFDDLETTNMANLFPPANLTVDDFPQVTGPTWHPDLAGTTLHSITRQFDDAMIQHWQLSVQREVVRNLLVEVGYLGSHGYHGQRRINYNQAHLDRAGETTNFFDRIPYPDLSNFTFIMEHSAQNTYNAGYVRVERRFDKGFSLLSSYTLAKTLDDYGNLNDNTGFWAQNAYDKKGEKGRSQFHAKHRWTIAYIWEAPLGRGKRFHSDMHPVLDGIIGGWQISGITTFQSGNTFSIWPEFIDFSNTGQFWWAQRGDQVKPGKIDYLDPHKNDLQYFDADYFANPEFGTFGDSPRNVGTNPMINSWDINVAKAFRIAEGVRLQFRLELYNAFNHTQFIAGNYSANIIGLGSLGQVTQTRAPRNIQLGLRLEF